MAKSVNEVRLLGHVGRDPEFKNLRSGTAVANVSLATSERVKDGEGWKDRTEWHYITLYGKLAEIVRDYVKKGDRLYLGGRLRTDSWDDSGTTRYRTHIIAEDVTLLGLGVKKADGSSSGGYSTPAGYSSQSITEDDIPF